MTFRIRLVLLLLAFASVAFAGGTRLAVKKTIESSLLVTGTIEIERDGSVGAYRLDQPDQLPPAARELAAKAVPTLRFMPIVEDGVAIRARTNMAIRMIANKAGDDSYSVRIGGISFDEDGRKSAIRVDGAMTPPQYPYTALRSGVQGTAYLVLKIDPQGVVRDVFAEQVNLTVIGSEPQMRQGRDALAGAAKAAARKWRFVAPFGDGSEPFVYARVPVDFVLCSGPVLSCANGKRRGYGVWESYVPGPRQSPPWITDPEDRRSSDAMVAGVFYPVGSGPKLLTSLSES